MFLNVKPQTTYLSFYTSEEENLFWLKLFCDLNQIHNKTSLMLYSQPADLYFEGYKRNENEMVE